MQPLKREGDLKDEDTVPKKAKPAVLLNNCVEIGDKDVRSDANPGMDKVVNGNNCPERTENSVIQANNQAASIRKPTPVTSASNSEAPGPGNERISTIDADAAEDKGSRHSMEDAWVVLIDASLEYPGKLRCSHFAIYDGHGGRLAAEFAQKNLHKNVLSAGLPRELLDIKSAKKAIIEGFRKTDDSLLQESIAGGWQDGATAVCIWVLGQTVLVANIGDAKAVVARSSPVDDCQTRPDANGSLKAIVVTREHKAFYPQERSRIQKVGGTVGANGRLQGRLEVSRAFGDRQFKKVGVIATPDVHSFELSEREQFIIMGCDGLWGVFGPSDAVEFVQKQLQEGLSATAAARRLVREAVRDRHCKDNCTAIVIVFKHGSHHLC